MEQKLDKILIILRNIREESAIANSLGGGNIAGTSEAGDDPPVTNKKKKKYIYGGRGSRKLWIQSQSK